MIRLKNVFKKYAVICYVVHAERIAWCDTFYSLNAAKKYLKEFASRTLKEEKYFEYTDDIVTVNADIKDDYAYIERRTQYDIDEYGWMRWTYEITEIDRYKVNLFGLHLEEKFINPFRDKLKNKFKNKFIKT